MLEEPYIIRIGAAVLTAYLYEASFEAVLIGKYRLCRYLLASEVGTRFRVIRLKGWVGHA